jgi:2,4-dienoyl-CoA reductase (NADPH2)
MYTKLFSPIKINRIEIKNRISMPAFGLLYHDSDRRPSERLLRFYEARAKGGCGLLIVGGVAIDQQAAGPTTPSIESDAFIADWRHFTDALRGYGARVFIQLFHAGRYVYSALLESGQSVAPSAVRSPYTGDTPRALEQSEIVDIEDKFAQAALRAKKAGADGVEIIASAGYLICQFISPITNKRDDLYGGSFDNRVRFGCRVIEKTRQAVGPDFPVIMRLSGNEFVPGGNNSRDIIEIAKVFEKSGLDAFNVTGGWHETKVPQLPASVPRGAFSYLAAGIRKAVSVPVFASNRVVTPAQAERILLDGIADIVNIGRGHIADPEWANKARTGRASEIRPCVGCLQGCMDQLFLGSPVECLTNPEAGHEIDRKVAPAPVAKTVVVIGAGPAGLEAALTADQRGHRVWLFEASAQVGGQLPLVASPPGREEFGTLLPYYQARLQQSHIELELNKRIGPSDLAALKPDAVILATGSRPSMPPIKGIDRRLVVAAWDVLLNRADLGKRVGVIGGGATGVETAIFIADQGTLSGESLKFLLKHGAEDFETLKALATKGTREVIIVEQFDRIGGDFGRSNRWVFLKEVHMLGIRTITNARVVEIAERGLVYEKNGQQHLLEVDSVVMALGSVSNSELEEALKTSGISYKKVGDVSSPRTIMHAVHEGFLAASDI